MTDRVYISLVYGGFFLGMMLLSFLINGLFLKFVSTLGIRNPEEKTIRWSPAAKPSLGGISFFLIFLISVASFSIFFESVQMLFNKQLLGLLAACTLAFLLGLSDDAYNTRPFLKLSIQICCALILIFTGTVINFFESNLINYSITFLWVVGMMNSINMLDNMDAITTVVSLTIILNALMLLGAGSGHHSIYSLMLIGVASALTGFLFYNWHPSQMFMGDTGSQFLGLFLAAIGILFFWNTPDTAGHLVQSKQILSTVLAFAVPIIDTTTVVINRIKSGRSPFVGGKDHTTHHFFYMGLTEKRIAILYAGIGLVSVFLNFLIMHKLVHWDYLHIFLLSLYFLLLFWFLYRPTLNK